MPQQLPAARKVRAAPASFTDHTSQPRMFYRSLSAVEQQHLVDAYVFELSKCYEKVIRDCQLQALADIDTELCTAIAAGLGMAAPEPSTDLIDVETSAALSQVGRSWPVDGRTLAILAGPSSDPEQVASAVAAAHEAKLLPLVISDTGAPLGAVVVQRALPATRSVEYDAIVVADGRTPSPLTDLLLAEAYRHAKGIVAWGDGLAVVDHAGCPSEVPGVVAADGPAAAVAAAAETLALHRVWER